MKISILTLFPNMINGFFQESIVKRAQEKKLVEIELVNLRDFAVDDYGSVDDRPYGGGVGMIMRVDVIYSALSKISNFQVPISKQISNIKYQSSKRNNKKIVITSPKGKQFTQKKAKEYSSFDHLVIIAGHYEGVDERVLDYVDEEVSLDDFVMTGGEIAASAIVDSTVRLIPGVLKKEEATSKESFSYTSIKHLIEVVGENKHLLKLKAKGIEQVKLLEYPQYTRPEEFMGKKVPKILLSGNHKEIERWRIKQAFEETVKKRQDIFIEQ